MADASLLTWVCRLVSIPARPFPLFGPEEAGTSCELEEASGPLVEKGNPSSDGVEGAGESSGLEGGGVESSELEEGGGVSSGLEGVSSRR